MFRWAAFLVELATPEGLSGWDRVLQELLTTYSERSSMLTCVSTCLHIMNRQGLGEGMGGSYAQSAK